MALASNIFENTGYLKLFRSFAQTVQAYAGILPRPGRENFPNFHTSTKFGT